MPTAPLSIFAHFFKCVLRLGALSLARFIPLRLPCLPEKAHYCSCYVGLSQGLNHVAHSEFDDHVMLQTPQLLVFTLPHHTLSAALSCETFRREPATRWFDWSFAPTPSSHDRFERQNRVVPPPAFPQASHQPGIAHHLSGPTYRINRLSPHPGRGLLGPCFKTGVITLPYTHSISQLMRCT